jgi:Xaa-Pro aminopeptidase
VFGSCRHHAELAWLTHFTPKLEPGLAIIPRNGAQRLFVGGGVNMLPAAAPLTWIADLQPLRDAPNGVAAWARAVGGAPRLALVGGDAMPRDLHDTIMADLAAAGATDATARVAGLMARKSSRELATIRDACATLDAAARALKAAWRNRDGAAILAAEDAANHRGAQDVRTLVSPDGGRTLVPFADADAAHADPLGAYIAVRHRGYWAEGFVTLATAPPDALADVRLALQAAIAAACPRLSLRTLGDLLNAHPGPAHDVVARSAVAGMGLALDTPVADQATLAENEVYSLRAGMRGVGIVSAMVAMTPAGAEVLWQQA